MRKVTVFMILLLATFVVGCGDKTGGEGGDVLVRVGDYAITTEAFETEFNRIPAYQRKEFETPDGKQKLLDRLIEMRLLYMAAEAEGLADSEVVQTEFAKAQEQVLIRQYYTTYIEAESVPGDADISAYYDEHKSEFAVEARVKARMVLAADRAAADAVATRLHGGEDMSAVARNESEDGPTAAEDGDLGWFSTDGYIRSIGVNPDFAARVFTQETNAIGAPIEIAGKGWAVVRIEDKEAAHQKELAEVRDEIGRRMAPKFKETVFNSKIAELKTRFGVEYVSEDYVNDDVLITVGDFRIDTAAMNTELQRIPPFQRREYENPEGKRKLVERLVEMKVMFKAAEAEKLADDEDVIKEFERVQEQILMRQYFKDFIEAKAVPSDKEIGDYYAEHKAEYEMPARLHGSLILTADRAAAVAAANRVRGGEAFAAVAGEVSQDAATASGGGDLGWFTADGYVRSIGVNPQFTSVVFEQAVGAVGDPIEVEGKGWAVIQVIEKEAAHTKSREDARDEIINRLSPKIRQTFFEDSIEALKTRFGVEYVQENFAQASSAEELFELAQSAKSPHERIKHYEQIVERFQDSEHADRAQFMIGFVYSEELRDNERSRAAFERFAELFPDSDLMEDARYMLEAIEGKEPEFEKTDD
ncbi:MAG: hypothetical protein GY835_20640 [bacterium]|nr:hypothetical protein [bacterium]